MQIQAIGASPHAYVTLSALSLPRAQAALALLARRQESLRTHFVERGGQLLQAILPADDERAAPALQRRSLPGGADGAALAAVVDELSDQPFQLVGAGVPLRAVLIAVGADEHVLFIGNHHILRRAGSLSTAAAQVQRGSPACCALPWSVGRGVCQASLHVNTCAKVWKRHVCTPWTAEHANLA